jgi:putative transcriptional regulator
MSNYLDVKKKIYGDIMTSMDLNEALRKWRKIFNISQVDLARRMRVSPSVVSEYENNKERVPGTRFIRKYVNSLIDIDISRGSKIINLISKEPSESSSSGILSIKDFVDPISAAKYIEATESEIIVGRRLIENTKLYGHTIIDGIVAILSLSGEGFYKIYGRSTERVLIFTNVSIGRSPLVAVRVYPLKPRMVLLHGPRRVDDVGVRIAEKEGLILGLSKLSKVDELIRRVQNIS